ncbi:MAG: acyl-ACP--UDP-N-acetylglucosamine O-acyltransferase [Pseudomonadota bacterium]|nr:acyl-ACP--UDP-N-acetylglucosamine O-acyltransferase [Pseudomonadota bacterium]
MISPHAILEEGAVIGKDVSIGPFSIIGKDVKIGDGTTIGPHVTLTGHTRIGKNNRIFQYASVGEIPQSMTYKNEPTELIIGDNNVVREFCTLHAGTREGGGITRIGNDNFLMAYVHIAHDCILGDKIIFANGSSLAGHVVVGDHVIFGGFTLIHQFCKVGAHVMTGIGAVSFKDIPPYLKVAGNTARPYGINVKGLQRRGFTEDDISALKHAYRTLYRSDLSFQDAIEDIARLSADDANVKLFADFLLNSERGVVR